jgi:hypothetical protein
LGYRHAHRHRRLHVRNVILYADSQTAGSAYRFHKEKQENTPHREGIGAYLPVSEDIRQEDKAIVFASVYRRRPAVR